MDDKGYDEFGMTEFAWEAAPVGNVLELVSRYTHCTLCGAHLHFSHITDFALNLTQELAKCPECGLKGSHVTHRLQ